LFLVEALPANKGTNELSGQTYYGTKWDSDAKEDVKDTEDVFVFTATGYTFTNTRYGGTQEGAYAYDSSNSSRKTVWLGRTKINGKTVSEYYDAVTVDHVHHFVDDAAYRAGETNREFSGVEQRRYDSVEKTIE